MRASLGGVWTALPGRVAAVNLTNLMVDVQPMVTRAYKNEDGDRVPERLPVIPSCPVVFLGGSAGRLLFPVKKGDLGTLIFASSSLDNFLATGNEVDPADDRRNALSDAIFIHGLHTMTTPPAGYSDNDIVLDAGLGTKIKLGAADSNQSVIRGDNFISHLRTFITATSTATTAAQIATAAATFKAVLDVDSVNLSPIVKVG